MILEEIGYIKTGQVTYAVRDTEIDNVTIKQGDYMGVGDDSILSVGNSIDETTKEMISKLVDDDAGLISVYYGEEIDEETANSLKDSLEELYSDCDIELHYGGQPIYYYVVSVE